MPLRKKKSGTFRRVLIWGVVAVIIILMIISFAPVQNVTEVVLYP